MNDWFDLHIITQHHSYVYCGYFRHLVFGNSLTFSHIPLCFHAKPPNFPHLFYPRVIVLDLNAVKDFIGSNKYQTSTFTVYRVNPVGLIFNVKTMQIDAGHIKISSPYGGLLWASCHMDIVWYIGSSPRSDFLVP